MGFSCQILLDRPKDGIYRSGQVVEGNLRIDIEKPTKFELVRIFFRGKLKGKRSTKEVKNEDLISKEEFVSAHKEIFQNKEIEVGVYDNRFQFLLPEDLPSSFRDNTCTISYKILAEFKTPGKGKSKLFETEIPVYGIVKPYSEKNPYYGLTKNPFLSKKPIDLDIDIKNTCFVAGEYIKLNYLLSNESNVPVTGITTKLIEQITYKYDNKNKNVRRKILEQTVVQSRGVQENCELKIPCVVPTLPSIYSIQHSKYFAREYIVNVTVTLPFPYRNASVEVPVVVQASKSLQMDVNSKHNPLGCIPYITVMLKNFDVYS